ncbi:unnamed protein product [Albugo candida]|uniref:Charged multivesicular body protein 5 n=2 Tax=Albugo candida TaxID=65357 RepID=A0A024GUZ5_9STRA|nr:unnamed protein product [Albugo candida]|eukprot:CCI50623.1 unnamed protein product [Albugo candida]
MHRMFGQKNGDKLDISTVATNVDGRVAVLDEKIAQLNKDVMKYKQQLASSKNNASIKRQAIQALKRRKMYESQRDNLIAQSFNIEQAKFALETSKDTKETVIAMKYASAAMREDQKIINIDEIDSIHDDMVEMLEDMDEIQNSLGRSYGIGNDIDESELEAELTNLEDEWEEEKLQDETRQPIPSYLQPNSKVTATEGSSVISSNPLRASTRTMEETALPIMSAHQMAS